MYIKLFSSCK